MYPPPLGDTRTGDGDALASLVSAHFDQVAVEQFSVIGYVPRHDLWPFLIDSFYGLDAIPEAEAQAVLDALTLPNPVPWTVPMIQVQGRR